MALNIQDVIGAWKLKSFEIEKEGVSRPWRQNAHGTLIYSEDGYMSVSINSDHSEDDWLNSLLFYSGTYEVQGTTIKHVVLNATNPDRIGNKLIREATFDGKQMSLSAKGPFGHAILNWVKI